MTTIQHGVEFDPTDDAGWIVEDVACDPICETNRASRFAVSNGFLGMRCSRALDEDGRFAAPPRAYVAGFFDTAPPDGPVSALVPVPDWLRVRITSTIDSIERDASAFAPHRIVLDMRRGMLMTESRYSDARTPCYHVRSLHLASLATRSIGLQLIEIGIEHANVEFTLEIAVDERNPGLVPAGSLENSSVWRTETSGKRLGMTMCPTLTIDGIDAPPSTTVPMAWSWDWTSQAGALAHFDRIVALRRNDGPEGDAGAEARADLEVAKRLGTRGIVAAHEAAWAVRWHESDVVVEGDAAAQHALRFAIYHLNSAADPTDGRVSIGARALTGEDYHGHVFWDTEIYLVPFYTMTWPEAARALLMYRFHTLDGARAKATRMGWRGALYAWESADTGDETAPAQVVGPDRQVVNIVSGEQEQHISADVAYAVWNYWQATNDERFLSEAGAEILLETARFWASRATLEADGRRHIRNVVGPDEYHENIDDNAFTNVMARWNIRRALDVAAYLAARMPDRSKELSQRLGLHDEELAHWRTVADTIATGFDPKTGLFEQFEGYFDLEDIDLAAYAGRSVPMDVVLGRERTQKSQVIKQPDVVALLGLLPEEFPGTSALANFAYYEPRCGHGSSLSRAMHALVAARLGNLDLAVGYFEATGAIDLSDELAAIGGGVHIAAQGGLWLTAVFGFSGLSLRDDGLVFEPHVPDTWQRLSYRVQWRGRKLAVDIDSNAHYLEVTLEDGAPMTVFVAGVAHELGRETPVRTRFGSREAVAANA